MDCLVDTNILLRSAYRLHPASLRARAAMNEDTFQTGQSSLCGKAEPPRSLGRGDAPARRERLGFSPQAAADGLAKIKRLFHLLAETDDIFAEWEKLVLAHQVSGKTAYDARLVATMNIHQVAKVLTFNTDDFRRYPGITIIHPDEVVASKA